MKLHYSSKVTALITHKRVQPSKGYPAIAFTATKTEAIRICFYQQFHFSSLISVFLFQLLGISTHPGAFNPVGSDHSTQHKFSCVWVLCGVVAVIFTSTHQGNPVYYKLHANQRSASALCSNPKRLMYCFV